LNKCFDAYNELVTDLQIYELLKYLKQVIFTQRIFLCMCDHNVDIIGTKAFF